MFCGSVSAADVPSANFTSNVTSGTAPLSVQFNDTSTGNATSWSWDFGDGINSTDKNPVHKYTKAGKYSVSLTASNDAGNNTITQTNYITVLLNDAYVSTTGNDATGDGTSSNPYATIQKALDNVVSGGTVHLKAGTYTGTGNYGSTITRNVKIVGDGQKSTTINAAGSGNIFTINSGLNVVITNLTFANGTTTTNGGAIKNSGTLNITNCTFTGNRATSSGGAIYNAGSLTVSNSTFIGNTAASAAGIYNYGTLNVTSSVFTGNNGTTFAGAVFGDTAKVTYLSNCTFTNNKAPKGGALWNRGTLTVTGCVFTGNSANMGGAIQNTASGTTNVHYSSFANNTATSGSTIYMGTGTFNAEYNWWGSNNSPASQIYGNVDYNNWLYMTMAMDTTNIVNGSTVKVTVNFNTNFNNIYDGTDVVSIDPMDGTIPDGTVVTFTSDLGTFSQVTVTTINGTATTIFTATTLGNSTINATTDNQTLSSNITVRLATNILVNNVTCTNGDTVNLTTTLTDENGKGLPDKTVTLNVNGTNYTATTDSNGSVTVSYATSKAGIYSLIASFDGDSIYHDSSNNGTNYLIVQLNDVYVSPTGNDIIGGGTVSNPFKTLQYSLRCVVDGGKLHVLAGNYTGTGNSGLTISSNVNIVGDGQTSTIVTATSSGSMFTITMDEYGFRRATLTGTIPGNVFTINPGITVSISNLTLKNGSAVQGGAIYNNGNLSIANCTLTGNSVYQSDIYATYQYTYLYTFYRGGAIYNTGILSIADCTFTDNCASSSGGAIYNNGTLVSVSNCTFTNNTAVRGDGGAICNFGTITSVSGCSFTNNTAGDGGAICNGPVTNGFGIYSTLNATNCTFTGNTAATGWGGAILNGDAATLNLSKCSFTHNTAATGGSIYSWGPLTVNECTFMNNTADSSAAIFNRKNATLTGCTFLNNKSTRYSGGALCNSGNMNITGCVFKNNSAVAGGAIVNRPDGTIGVLSNCTFINNTATLNATYAGGGAIENGGILPSLIGCVFVNNTATYGSSIYDDSACNSMNAQYNWWGSNSDPSSQIYVSGGKIEYSNWLYMIETVDPTTVTKGGTATVTVSFNNVWNGTDVVSIDPASVHIPDGTVVTFSSALGSFSPVAIPTVNGTATTTFTANTTVVGLINGTTDDQTVSVEINKLNTTVMVGNVTGVGGSSVNLTATLTDSNGNALSGKTVTFYVNGKSYTATTDSNGVAKVSFTVKEDAGTYPVTVSFPGDNTYLNCTSDGTSNLMVILTVSANVTTGCYNGSQIVALTANDANATIYYSINGSTLTPYKGNITIGSTSTLSYLAIDSTSNLLSPVYTQTYNIDTAVPVVSVDVPGKLYNGNQTVKLTATDDTNTTIYYTTDNTDPQTSSTRTAYTAPITISNNTTLKYAAVDAAGNWAATQTQIYTIDTIAPTVSVNETAGVFNTAQSVALTSDDAGATVYYTTDGSDPQTSKTRTVYTAPITISNTTTLRYAAVDDAGNWAVTKTQIYTVDKVAPTAGVSVKAGTYNINKVVALSMSEAGTIYYTTDGSTPTTSSKRYSGAFTVGSTTTLRYMAVDKAGNVSPVYTARYVIDKVAPTVRSTNPKNKATDVSRSTSKTIVITFSENIKLYSKSLWSHIYVKNSKGKKVSISKYISGNKLTIKLNSKKSAYMWYTVYVPAGVVSDAFGNKLMKSYTFRFKTGRY